MIPRAVISFKSPVALFSTPVANLSFYGCILSTTSNLTCYHQCKGKSIILSRNRCYGLRPLMTALIPQSGLRQNADLGTWTTLHKPYSYHQCWTGACLTWQDSPSLAPLANYFYSSTGFTYSNGFTYSVWLGCQQTDQVWGVFGLPVWPPWGEVLLIRNFSCKKVLSAGKTIAFLL